MSYGLMRCFFEENKVNRFYCFYFMGMLGSMAFVLSMVGVSESGVGCHGDAFSSSSYKRCNDEIKLRRDCQIFGLASGIFIGINLMEFVFSKLRFLDSDFQIDFDQKSIRILSFMLNGLLSFGTGSAFYFSGYDKAISYDYTDSDQVTHAISYGDIYKNAGIALMALGGPGSTIAAILLLVLLLKGLCFALQYCCKKANQSPSRAASGGIRAAEVVINVDAIGERKAESRGELQRAQVFKVDGLRQAHVSSVVEAARLREENDLLRKEAALRILPFREVSASDVEYVLDESGARKKLGEGNFGEVFEGRYAGVSVAVKRLKMAALNEAEQREFRSEAMVHANMRHPNIVMLLAVCLEAGHFALVMEYMAGGSLYNLLHSGVMLSWNQRIDMAKQLVAGVMYLHGLADYIVHRDLKSANVLMARPYREGERVELKIGDFGLAKIKDAASSTSKVGAAGTVAWTAPEAFDDEPALTKKSDVYSLGVVFWEIASRAVPYAGVGRVTLERRIMQGMTNPIPDETPSAFAGIIQDCWKSDPRERPEARDLMPRIDALAAGFFGGGAGAGAGGGEASAAGPMYDGLSPTYH